MTVSWRNRGYSGCKTGRHDAFPHESASGFKNSRAWKGQNLRPCSSGRSSRPESIGLARLAKGKIFKSSVAVVRKAACDVTLAN